jgi:transposase-like protein
MRKTESNIKRKRKFTPETREVIYEALRNELSVNKASEMAGIDRSTFYRWMSKGKDENFPVHSQFRKKVKSHPCKLMCEKLEIISKGC